MMFSRIFAMCTIAVAAASKLDKVSSSTQKSLTLDRLIRRLHFRQWKRNRSTLRWNIPTSSVLSAPLLQRSSLDRISSHYRPSRFCLRRRVDQPNWISRESAKSNGTNQRLSHLPSFRSQVRCQRYTIYLLRRRKRYLLCAVV